MAATTTTTHDMAHVVFLLSTPETTATVHLLGSWDNFSSPILMKRDVRVSNGSWKVCLGSSRTSGSIRGLKMGARYTYYFVIDGHLAMPDPTVAEKQADPRTGMVCSVFYVPIEVAPNCQVTVGAHQTISSKPKARPAHLNLSNSIPFEKPAPSPTRANAPARPKVVIPAVSAVSHGPSSLSSSIPSLTPSSGLASATPSSAETPLSPFRSPLKTGKRKGFCLKTPCLPSFGSKSKNTPHLIISNPIPMNLDVCEGLRIMGGDRSPQVYAPRAIREEKNVVDNLTVAFERSCAVASVPRPGSVDSNSSSPSLIQSEFSSGSSTSSFEDDDDNSSISSSPMSDCFENDFEIDDDESGCQYSMHHYTTASAEEMEAAEEWYRSAGAKPRYSDMSECSKLARMSSVTYISESSQDILGCVHGNAANLGLPTTAEEAAGLMIYAPIPTRPCAVLDMQLE